MQYIKNTIKSLESELRNNQKALLELEEDIKDLYYILTAEPKTGADILYFGR